MKLTKNQVIKAIKIVCQGQVLPMDSVDKQIALSLQVYKNRNELQGNLQSAIECLELAGYEIEKVS